MSKLRLLVADDHGLVRNGLVIMLNTTPGMEVVGQTGSGEEAVRLVKQLSPDIALLDVSLPDLSGIEAARQIKARGNGVRVMALTMHADPDYAYQFLEAGGHGYWLKESDFPGLLGAILRLAEGEEVIAPPLMPGVERKRSEQAIPRPSSPSDITFREQQVLQLVCNGHSSKQIAGRLKISVRTVEQHRAHLMEKAGVSNAAALVNWAVSEKLVVPPI